MPTYEYECSGCHKVFDVFQSIKAKPLKRCPACQGKIRRLIGKGSGIIFKGKGFYQTDYRSEHYKKRAREDKKPAEVSGSKKETNGAVPAAKERKGASAKE